MSSQQDAKARTCLVIGAGTAGCSAALALHAAGWNVTIAEGRAEGDVRGYRSWFTVTPNGQHVLDVLGVRITESAPIDALALGSARVPMSSGQKPTLAIKREVLYGALLAEVERRGIPVHVEHAAEIVVLDGVDFSNGSSTRADLIVAADGLDSWVRASYFEDQELLRTYNSLTTSGTSTCKPASPLKEPRVLHFVKGERVSCAYVVDASKDEIYWFAKFEDTGSVENTRKHLLSLCEGDANIEIFRELWSSDLTTVEEARKVQDLPKLPKWWDKPGLVFIGSAAHACVSDSGIGVGLGLEDGIVLARCLDSSASITEGLAAFEAKRRPRCEKLIASGAWTANFSKSSWLVSLLQTYLLPTALGIFVRIKGNPNSWLYDYRADE